MAFARTLTKFTDLPNVQANVVLLRITTKVNELIIHIYPIMYIFIISLPIRLFVGTTKYSNTCQCCVGTNYDAKNVVLTCEDGYTFQQSIQVPSACTCQSCSDQQNVFGVNP